MVTSRRMRDPAWPARLDLLPGDVHVIRILLDGPADASVLNDDERGRAGRFHFDRDRRRFVAAHGWLRVTLGRCLDRRPESLRFVTGPYGKPRLVDPPVDLRFNLSHGGERALLAVTLGREVGVDVEEERPIEELDLAGRFFSAAEAACLRALPEADRRAAFFRCWTRKESFIKAVGEGLTFPLDAFEVSLGREDAPQLLRACQARGQALEHWRIVPLPIDDGYAAALAAEAGDWRVVRWNAIGP
ncbi:MAG: 4'-phosphopantetheinyl transferase family protein [Vicinamibacterales bacterium]